MNTIESQSKIVTYQDLVVVPVEEIGEAFVIIDNNIIPCSYVESMSDMASFLQGRIPVRLSIYEKLKKVQQKFKEGDKNLSLLVTYGYRSLEVQKRKFLEQLQVVSRLTNIRSAMELIEEVHRSIAVPTVAGHPTGGAVDVTIIYKSSKEYIDCGSTLYDFSDEDCYFFSPNISEVAKRNRTLLRSTMIAEGFAPFDGEWWHFSFGDREWACYYQKQNAIYDQVPERRVTELMI